MTRSEAETLADRHSHEHPDRATHRWITKEQADGSWTLVKVRMPPGMDLRKLKTFTESKPKPPQPDDPRSTYDRNVGGPWVG